MESVPEEIYTEEPLDAKPVSILFMGETIIAPGHYPDVPDEYIPVLDDLYLYGELSIRYNTLNYEGKITQEIMFESENAQSEIQNRGYLPYSGSGFGSTGGYALIDLDKDGSSELIILNNSPYLTQPQVIKSVSDKFVLGR